MVKTTLKIEGMMCSNCEKHMNEAIKKNCKVKKVESSHDSGQTVIISEQSLEDEKIQTAVDEAGYKLLGKNEEPYEKKSLFGLKK